MNQEEPVTFTVVRTSDAATKEVSISTASTKLNDLKRILADEECFGPEEAPVRRQRIFHLGREFKSGGRSLSNLGLGRFNNRIIHLSIRPCEEECERNGNASGQQQSPVAAVGARKRRRTDGNAGGEEGVDASSLLPLPVSSPLQSSFLPPFPFMNQNQALGMNNDNDPDNRLNNAIHASNALCEDRGMPATYTYTNTNSNNNLTANNNSAIDLMDSSDDEEVEVIEIS